MRRRLYGVSIYSLSGRGMITSPTLLYISPVLVPTSHIFPLNSFVTLLSILFGSLFLLSHRAIGQ